MTKIFVIESDGNQREIYECPREPAPAPVEGVFPKITNVVPSIINTDKAWYEAGTVLGPYNKHPNYAADWNLETMGDTDLGEPIGSPFDGVVINAENYYGGWGNIVRVLGLGLASDGNPTTIVWMGAHFLDIKVSVGQVVTPGQLVGTVGKGWEDQYSAHLHEQFSIGRVMAPTSFVAAKPFVSPIDFYKWYGVPEELVDRLVYKRGD